MVLFLKSWAAPFGGVNIESRKGRAFRFSHANTLLCLCGYVQPCQSCPKNLKTLAGLINILVLTSRKVLAWAAATIAQPLQPFCNTNNLFKKQSHPDF